jgi:hypothetical protein
MPEVSTVLSFVAAAGPIGRQRSHPSSPASSCSATSTVFGRSDSRASAALPTGISSGRVHTRRGGQGSWANRRPQPRPLRSFICFGLLPPKQWPVAPKAIAGRKAGSLSGQRRQIQR